MPRVVLRPKLEPPSPVLKGVVAVRAVVRRLLVRLVVADPWPDPVVPVADPPKFCVGRLNPNAVLELPGAIELLPDPEVPPPEPPVFVLVPVPPVCALTVANGRHVIANPTNIAPKV